MKIFLAILILIIALIAFMSVVNYVSSKRHSWLSAIMLWVIFPISFPEYVKDEGMVKHWWIRIPLMLVAPAFLFVYMLVVLYVGLIIAMGTSSDTVPKGTSYHTAYDLYKATGVEFPEVVPVDSIYHEDFSNNYEKVILVPKKPLTKEFYERLDRACKEDSICWSKDRHSNAYYYRIYPVENLDRTNKKVSPYRMVGDTYDWDGAYITVNISAKGDTITVEDGWTR